MQHLLNLDAERMLTLTWQNTQDLQMFGLMMQPRILPGMFFQE